MRNHLNACLALSVTETDKLLLFALCLQISGVYASLLFCGHKLLWSTTKTSVERPAPASADNRAAVAGAVSATIDVRVAIVNGPASLPRPGWPGLVDDSRTVSPSWRRSASTKSALPGDRRRRP